MENIIRRSYHTDIKIAEKLGVLPAEYKQQIPKASLHRFRNTDYSQYFGIELADTITGNINLIKKFAGDRKALQAYKAYVLIKSMFIKCFITVPKNISLAVKKRLVLLVEKFRTVIGFEKVLKLLKLTKYRFYLYYDQVMHQCKESVLKLCRRRHHNQLTPKEVGKIKELLESDEYMGWPIFSVANKALTTGKLCACVNTWYKYANLLGVNRHKKKWHRGKTDGIRAERIHQLWHADVTLVKLINNLTCYIYLVIENISKFILSFRVSLKLSAEIRKETIKEAYEKYILPTDRSEKTILLVDGGRENNNEMVEEYLKKDAVTMEKIIAQVDIAYSNSMIEAVNRVLKQRYLYYHTYPDINYLEKVFTRAVYDYNEKCPHISHKGLTPREVLENIIINKAAIIKQMELARKNRIAENKKANCGLC